ncbi:MAG: ABC transporter substrate-binding protein [Treponema sp.]|jgi:iron(III) transport system substrate-binding protein|nr:ABC transporter substrate-binding protein [Treponema sp.]
MKRVLTVVLVLLFAVGTVWAQNSVSAYTTLEEPLAKALFEQFKKETGITVNFVRLSGGEAVARMEAEAANPQVSIWVGGVGLDHITAKSKNLTIPYVSRFATNTRAEFRDPQNYWIGLYVGPLTFVTNLDRAKALGLTPPKSWADLLKPEYKGQIRMANPSISGTAYNVITTIRTLNNGNENAAFEYLKNLDANIDQYARSGSAPGKSVATGEIPIAIGYAHDQVKLKSEGANVEIDAPTEGTGYELASMSLIRGGKDAVPARRLYDWILSSKSAQQLFTQWYLVLIANGAEKHPLALSLDQISTIKQDMAWDGDGVNKNRLLDRWNQEIGSKR